VKQKTSECILLVEDSETQALRLQHFLGQHGLAVSVASSAEAALEQLSRELPDLVITDMHLPGVPGVELCRRLRLNLNTRGIPILLLTSEEDAALEARALESGADDFVRKSEEPEILLLRIQALLRKSNVEEVLASAEARFSSAKILVVEDSATYRALLVNELEPEGYRLKTAETGELALACLAMEPFDAMILDVVLPDMSGHEVCRRMVASRRTVDNAFMILALTGQERREEISALLDAGADDVIGKSRDMGVIKARLRALIRRKLLFEENRRIAEDVEARERALLAERSKREVAETRAALVEQLERATADAEQASRAKSAFLATMSHEIRTPMNGILGMVEVLAHTRLSEHQTELVGTIERSASALLRIIDEILDFSKIESGRLEIERAPFCVVDLVEDLCSSLAPLADRAGVDLCLFISPLIPESVDSDRIRLRQVLYNLLGNAIKFSGGRPQQRGRVKVRVEVVGAAPLRLTFTITDDGIGIAPEALDKLFSPFVQAEVSTTRRFGGTGLGLAICKRLVDLMQGEIAVSSIPGEGSTFAVTLPFEVAADQSEPWVAHLSGLDCIVVESQNFDDADLRIYLEHAGAHVHLAADDAAATRAAAGLASPVIVIEDADPDQGERAAPRVPITSPPDVGRVLIARGRHRRPRAGAPGTVTIDGNVLRRQDLLRAVMVAAGRASIEVFHRSAARDLSNERTQPPSIADARAQGRLLLIAEDDEINQTVILHQLGLLGYAAEFAANGTEALRLWRNGGYALLFTDLHMPEMDGYALAQRIRLEEAGRWRTPILALTANALQSEANRARAAGIDEYLTKPVRLPALKAALDAWLPIASAVTPFAAQPQDICSAPAVHAVDVTVLKGLAGDDPKIVLESLGDYLASLRSLTSDLRTACAGGDARQVGTIAHKLKSSSRSVGALALGDQCAELENASRAADKAAIAHRMVQFDAARAEVEVDIAGLLAARQL